MIRACTLLALCGCDVVFQQEHVEPLPPPDAAPSTLVVITTSHVYVENDQTSTPLQVQVPERLATAVVLADGTLPALTFTETGATFERPAGMAYQLSVERDPVPLDFQLATPTLQHMRRDIRRQDAVAPLPDTTVKVAMSNAPGLGTTGLYSTGVWAGIFRTTGSNGAFTVPWTSAAPIAGTLGLPDGARGDKLWCVGAQSIVEQFPMSYDALTHVAEASTSTLANGAETPVTCAATTISRSKCAVFELPWQANATRLSELSNAAYYKPGGWSVIVLAQPVPALFGGLVLATDSGSASDLPGSFTMRYGNPFAGHYSVARWTLSRSRTIENGTTDIVLNVAMSTALPAPEACEVLPDVNVPVPTVPAVNNVQLVTDGPFEVDRTKPLELTWQFRQGDVIDYTVAHLMQVTPAGLVDVKTWVTLEPRVTIEPELLVQGERYVIRLDSNGGLPLTRDGDFVHTSWPTPVTTSTQFSAVITITN